MSKLVKNGSKYSDDQRMEVAILYAISGNAKNVAKATGIPRTTIVSWKKADWWDDAVTAIQSEKADEHRAKYLELVDKAQRVTLEKLPEASAAQASIIAATATDKIRLLDNMPTEITGNSGDMKALAKKFEDMVKDKEIVVVKTYENDKTEEKDDE